VQRFVRTDTRRTGLSNGVNEFAGLAEAFDLMRAAAIADDERAVRVDKKRKGDADRRGPLK